MSEVFAADIHPGARFGKGILLDHGQRPCAGPAGFSCAGPCPSMACAADVALCGICCVSWTQEARADPPTSALCFGCDAGTGVVIGETVVVGDYVS